ncbi:hypothetical protein M8C21_011571, partial [Ambrosia artemisiifolia]
AIFSKFSYYSLAPASRLLLKNEPLSVRPFLLAMLDPMLVDPWQDMSKWFQTDEVNPFQTTLGKIFWDLAGKEWILHDWSDEECMKILKQCKEAIPCKENGGKIIIIDMVVKVHEGENNLLETQLFYDMLMMTLTTERERSEEDWAKLFLEAGFSD